MKPCLALPCLALPCLALPRLASPSFLSLSFSNFLSLPVKLRSNLFSFFFLSHSGNRFPSDSSKRERERERCSPPSTP
ncbi:hypothetical protein IE53DRAFT_385343 [Violaceomyces palustris]|uniref:Uncharacterized protein n=1 Tax=Violaceomyces palustris TaxID=1673888 RepID=A0ACD0P2F0_9BASI|nr:hypothetical protein IE53DRAFT_385343 [Violaceomyces palustris]